MSEALGATVLAVLALVAFLPPILYLAWVRSFERYHREPWGPLARAFLWGAAPAVVAAAVLEAFLMGAYFVEPTGLAAAVGPAILSSVVVAPLVEEGTKGVGLRWVRDHLPEPEDGLVYGAAIGLGFAAMENLFYIADALVFQGVGVAAATAVLRVFASALLHAAASAAVGFAVWRVRYGGAGAGVVVAGYGAAVLMHGGFNLLASLGYVWSVGFAVALAVAFFARVRRKVMTLDGA